MKKTALLIFGLALSSRLCAVEGAAYLKSPQGPRSTGMAGAYGAVFGSAESMWYNPAGLSGLDGAQASFSHESLDAGFDSDHLVASALLGWQHSIGLLYNRTSATDSYRNASGDETGTFMDSDSVLGLGYSYDLDLFSLGASAKLLNENVEKLSGSGMVYDFGAQGRLSNDHVLWGLSLQNLGSAPKLGDPGVGISPPLSLRSSFGLHYGDPSQALLMLGDYRYLFVSGRSGLALGAEYSEHYDDNSLALRCGYDFGANDLGGFSGFSAGVGFGFKFIAIDYTYMPLDILGASHRIALTVTYDQKAKVEESAMAEYLHLSPAQAPSPTPVAAKIRIEHHVAGELEALLAATPTPSPTPLVQEKPKEAPKGIFGAIFSFFSFGKKEKPAENAPPKPSGGILRGFFHALGITSGDDQPALAPEKPAPQNGDEDKFSSSPVATPQATPTAAPKPMIDQFKNWIKN